MERLASESLENSLVFTELASMELKFLQKLLEAEGHRALIAVLKPNSRTSLAKCDLICQSLAARGFVEYDSEICRFTLSAPGRMLLSLQTTSLPVTPDELKLLRACRGSMTPDKLGNCVPANMRSQLIGGLVERKLLKVIKRTITEVRLTETGKAALVRQLW